MIHTKTARTVIIDLPSPTAKAPSSKLDVKTSVRAGRSSYTGFGDTRMRSTSNYAPAD